MGVVIIEDQVIEAILERLAVNVLMHEDGNVVVLVFVPEVKGDNLCAWRYYRLVRSSRGFGICFFIVSVLSLVGQRHRQPSLRLS